MEPEQKNAQEEQAPKKAFKLNKSHVQGFVVGVVIAAVIALGLWAGFGDSDFFSGATDGATPTTYVMFPEDTAAGGSASEIRLLGFNWEIEGFQPVPNLTLQDVSGKPLSYQSSDNKSAAPGGDATVSGDIKYFANPGLPQTSMLGEIRLIKDLDAAANPGYIPCDGRKIDIRSNQALYSLLGNTFGGDTYRYFEVPNLPDSPVSGAKYYTISRGEFPYRK